MRRYGLWFTFFLLFIAFQLVGDSTVQVLLGVGMAIVSIIAFFQAYSTRERSLPALSLAIGVLAFAVMQLRTDLRVVAFWVFLGSCLVAALPVTISFWRILAEARKDARALAAKERLKFSSSRLGRT